METVSIDTKTNFFEFCVAEYSLAKKIENSDDAFNI